MFYSYFDPFSMLFHFVFWILAIWFVIWILRSIAGHRSWRRDHFHSAWCNGENCGHPIHGGRALELLKERFVKGEISKEEFEEKKRAIL